jgi:hypothetical protein
VFPDGCRPAVYVTNADQIKRFFDESHLDIGMHLPHFISSMGAEAAFPLERQINSERFASLQARRRINELVAQQARSIFLPTIASHSSAKPPMLSMDPSLLWMRNREPYLAYLSNIMFLHINHAGTFWQPDFTRLFDPDLCLCGNGRWFICLALSSKSSDVSRLALDILIAAIDELRIDAESLGGTMSCLLPSKMVTPIRWARALRESSRVSALHALFSWKVLAAIFKVLADAVPTSLLEVMLELRQEYKFPGDVETEQTLQSLTKAKPSKLVSAIQKSATRLTDNQFLIDASNQSRNRRIATAQRWQAAQLQSRLQTCQSR